MKILNCVELGDLLKEMEKKKKVDLYMDLQ